MFSSGRFVRTLRVVMVAMALGATCYGVRAGDAGGPGGANEAPATPGAATQTKFETLAERLNELCLKNHVPGMAIGVVSGDEVFLHAFGMADLEAARPVDADTRFAIGSTTKAMTATMIAQLVEAGAMAWDEPVRTHMPAFALADAESDEAVTIRDLLCHRAGLASLPLLWYGTDATAEQIVEAIARAELMYPVGTQFHYSNMSYMVAGMAAANAAGAPSWHELIRERLLVPLDMAGATTRQAPALADPAQATGYRWNDEDETLEARPLRRLDVIAPAGSVNASAREMTHWLRMLLDRGEFQGSRIVGEAALAETWTPQIDAFGAEYALGWVVTEWQGRRMLMHTGGIDGFAAIVVVLPDDALAYVLLVNREGTPVPEMSQGVVLEAMLATSESGGVGGAEGASDPTSAEWPRLTGTYIANFGPFTDAEFRVLVSGERLAIDIPGQMTYQLRAPDDEGKRAFMLTDDVKVRFNQTDDGEVYSLTMFQAGYRFEAPRQGVEQPGTPVDRHAVRGFLGAYRFEELGVDVEILIEHDRLAIDVPGQTTYLLRSPDEQGRWVFEVKDSIWVLFDEDGAPGESIESITLVQDGQETVLARVAEAPGTELPTVDALMSSMRDAMGGDALDALRGIRLEGTVRVVHQGATGRLESLEMADGRLRSLQDYGAFGEVLAISDGRRVWIDAPYEPGHVAEAEMADMVLRDGILYWLTDWRERGERVVIEERVEFEGRDAFRVRVDMEDAEPVVWFVDAESMLPIAQRSTSSAGGQSAQIKVQFGDYRSVGGVTLPHAVTSENAFTGRVETQYTSVELNPEVPAGAFDIPPR